MNIYWNIIFTVFEIVVFLVHSEVENLIQSGGGFKFVKRVKDWDKIVDVIHGLNKC